jgi:adenosylhomocysteine nucleosidase
LSHPGLTSATLPAAKLGLVVGLAAEARIAARFSYTVLAGGGTPEGAAGAADKLVRQGVHALLSFGFAGGLDPALTAGTLVIPTSILSDGITYPVDPALAERFGGCTGHRLLAATEIAADAATKRRFFASTRAHAIDLESGAVARVAQAHSLPFVALRAISDPADRDLPPAALIALDRNGGIALIQVFRSILHQPSQLPALLQLATAAARARRTLVRVARHGRAAAETR